MDEIGLKYLGQVYFHQDYDLDADTPGGVVRNFANDEDLQYPKMLHRQLSEILSADLTEEMARQLWMTEGDSAYDPARDGKSYVGWLTEMFDILGEVITQRQLAGHVPTD